jgi:hypothetical protein
MVVDPTTIVVFLRPRMQEGEVDRLGGFHIEFILDFPSPEKMSACFFFSDVVPIAFVAKGMLDSSSCKNG